MANWDNYIMRKYGPSIKKKIAEAHDPFVKGVTIVAAHKTIAGADKTDMMDYADKTLDAE
jgi:hypothetical protein